MVRVGETTGTLARNLESLSEEYETQLDLITRNLTVLVEPVLMICMGVLVGFVALAIITPIYAVTQNLT
jgi:type IV pilus assembly protein PilC